MDEQGLYVCWAAFAGLPPRSLSHAHALRLKQRIAAAVVAAGMGRAPAAQDPVDAALREQGEVPRTPDNTLFIGTFGQVEDAFDALRIVAVAEAGVSRIVEGSPSPSMDCFLRPRVFASRRGGWGLACVLSAPASKLLLE